MIFTIEQLKQILPNTKNLINWYDALSNIDNYAIDTPERVASFLSQCAHESADFTRVTENLNYRWESLRRVFPK
jgi:putative chitinase